MQLHVQDMSCEGCARSVTRAVTRLDAQAIVRVNLAAGTVDVETAAAPEAVASAIAEAGYPVTAG